MAEGGTSAFGKSSPLVPSLCKIRRAGSDRQGQGTITDNDSTPTLSINNVTVTERTGSTFNAAFTVRLSAASNLPVSVTYAAADNTAVAPGDYTSSSGLLMFAAGQTTKTILVPIIGDSVRESSESLFVNLTNALNALFADSQGLGTVLDND